jgi:cytochrome P450
MRRSAVPEPSIFAALKAGFREPATYYTALHEFGGSEGAFFDKYLSGHVIVSYEACQEIYRNSSAFGRGRLSFPSEYFADCEERPRVSAGYRTLEAMSVFRNADAGYAARRQRLLGVLGSAKKAITSGVIETLAARHIEGIELGQEVDVFSTSLRRYAAQCATVALIGTREAREDVTADAIMAAYFFDGKRPSRSNVLDALEAFDRLGEWIACAHGLEREDEHELVADLVLLYVAAHESLAYLLYTALVRLTQEADLGRFSDREAVTPLVAEAARFDSPVQMSGRVVLNEVTIGEATFQPGEKVYVHVGAANRDERVFRRPHDFLERRELPHLAFGWGPTRCVGSEYAAACAHEYLSLLLSRVRRITHRSEATIFDHGLSARGLKAAFFTCM